ncbi:N-acetylmuramoyl-L-alanine amidase-like domain-containing protein [Petrimonas sp.]|uniref:N-acetylmuramoyl-L-alanine amidase-like domain-containing protein n=1 Tax=Petrimonas sp. TaxID=2023866 RepID=UPI002CD675DC|nr:DUF1460 domain-containing protein [Petrimonas sp.]
MLPKPIHFFLFFSFFFDVQASFTQSIDWEPQDKIIFEHYRKHIDPIRSKSKELILQQTAEFFLNAPYVAGTLDKNDTERLVINLREFDCVTFVETVIALANTVVSDDLSFDNFASQLKRIRYRNGIVDGYDSRLHYTSDWIYDNVKKKILSEASQRLGGISETKTIDFMTTHRTAYRLLKTDDQMLERIRNIEGEINARGGFYYLPKEKLESAKVDIPHMAMIAFTTSIKGLDTTHTGFAYKKDGKLTFIHASSAKNNVVIDEKTLSDYCKTQKKCTGITVMLVR